ncbi:FHA domain-containing protein [Streptomyces sp. SP2-10]|uniref:FHA domain-containing protein n=1 Tax=Streptomyces sp. SP2-10 TaxID=2873385 RepID=UPI001CA6F440|nr:FHA domain-containing protein [Streptomyces sp. SP2-10]MBY8843978.1 FHA domain-containing protein [Streptomyces sp. SP2-10]
MQIRLTVVDPLGPSPQRGRAACRDVLVTAPAGTELAAVASALAGAVTGESGAGREAGGASVVLYAGAERLDPRRRTLGEPPLVDGAVLSLGAPAAPEPHPELDDAPTQLHVVAGPDAGGVHLLHGGRITVGRSADADVPLDDPDVSRLHCAVTVGADGRVSVADLGSTNGTSLDGTRVTDRPVRFAAGSLLRIGESALRVTPFGGPGMRIRTVPDGEGCVRITMGGGDGSPRAGGPGGEQSPPAAARGRGGAPAGRSPSPGAGAPAGTVAPPAGAGSRSGRQPSAGAADPGAAGAPSAGPGNAARGATHHTYGPYDSAGWGASGDGAGAQEHRRGQSPVVPGQAGAPGVESRDHGSGASGTAPGGDTHAGQYGASGTTPGGDTHTGHYGASGTAPGGDTDAGHYGAGAGYAGGTGGEGVRAGGRKGTPVRGTEVPPGVRQGKADAPQGTRRRGLGAWARRLAGGRVEQPAVPAAYDGTAVRAGGAPAPGVPRQPETWPDPAALLLTALGPGPRLWERGPGHPEALTVRLGTADRSAPDGSGLLPAVPVTAALREAGALGLAGPRPRLSGLARAVLAQLAALHSPDLLEIVLISADHTRPVADRTAEWAWLGWLPHVRPGHGQDCRLLLAYDREQAAARTEELLRRVEDHAATGRTTAHPAAPRGTDPAEPGARGGTAPYGTSGGRAGDTSPAGPSAPGTPDAAAPAPGPSGTGAHPGAPDGPAAGPRPANPGASATGPHPAGPDISTAAPRPGTPTAPYPGTPGVPVDGTVPGPGAHARGPAGAHAPGAAAPAAPTAEPPSVSGGRGTAPGNHGTAPGSHGTAPGNHGAGAGAGAGSHGTAPRSHGTAPGNHGTAPGSHGTAPGSHGTAPGSHGAGAGVGSHGAGVGVGVGVGVGSHGAGDVGSTASVATPPDGEGAARRPSWARADAGPAGAGGFAGPYTVVVVDGDPGGSALRDALARLAVAGPRAGIHVVCLAETEPASPASPVTRTYEAACAVTPTFRHCGAVALLSGDVAAGLQLLRVAPGGPAGPGTQAAVDAVSAAWAERFARALAPLRPDGPAGEPLALVSAPLPQSARLLDELGLARATPASLMARWADAADDTESLGGRARAVLGAGPRGPVTADLVADGPHLLIEGPAGSGRTELLRTVVASLAAAERPDRLAVVLLDGRDGVGTGSGRGEGLRVCTDIPHVTTHLIANDPVRMREFAQSLAAELKRRAELLGRTDFARWHAGREVSGRMVTQRSSPSGDPLGQRSSPSGDPLGQRSSAASSGDIEAPPSSTLRLRPGAAARQRAAAVPPLPRLVVVVDDLDALVSPALGSPGRPAAGSVIRALEAVAREGERLGVHLVAAAASGGRTAESEPALRASLRVVLDAPQPGPDQPAPGRGRLAYADGRAVGLQGGRVTGRIPRTATQRPTVVPLDWQRMGDPPARRPVRELGNGPTDLALLASAVERAAREVAAAEVPSLL